MIKRIERYKNKKTGEIVEFYFNSDLKKYVSDTHCLKLSTGILCRHYEYLPRNQKRPAKFKYVTNINGFSIREKVTR